MEQTKKTPNLSTMDRPERAVLMTPKALAEKVRAEVVEAYTRDNRGDFVRVYAFEKDLGHYIQVNAYLVELITNVDAPKFGDSIRTGHELGTYVGSVRYGAEDVGGNGIANWRADETVALVHAAALEPRTPDAFVLSLGGVVVRERSKVRDSGVRYPSEFDPTAELPSCKWV